MSSVSMCVERRWGEWHDWSCKHRKSTTAKDRMRSRQKESRSTLPTKQSLSETAILNNLIVISLKKHHHIMPSNWLQVYRSVKSLGELQTITWFWFKLPNWHLNSNSHSHMKTNLSLYKSSSVSTQIIRWHLLSCNTPLTWSPLKRWSSHSPEGSNESIAH